MYRILLFGKILYSSLFYKTDENTRIQMLFKKKYKKTYFFKLFKKFHCIEKKLNGTNFAVK